MEEVELFCQLLGHNDAPEIDFCKQLCKYMNGDFSNFIDHELNIPEAYKKPFQQFLESTLDTNEISRTQENIFTSTYENDFFKIHDNILENGSIEEIVNKKIFPNICLYLYVKIEAFLLKSFLQIVNYKTKKKFPSFKPNEINKKNIEAVSLPSNKYIDLIHYMFVQFFRSQKQINNLKTIIKKYSTHINIKEDSFVFILLHLQSIYLTETLIRENYKLVLLENKTGLNFITSDSPCINLCATYIKPLELKLNDFEIYLPLSPKYALLYSNREGYKNVENSKITLVKENDIKPFNSAIKKSANRYIYSCNEIDLLKCL